METKDEKSIQATSKGPFGKDEKLAQNVFDSEIESEPCVEA